MEEKKKGFRFSYLILILLVVLLVCFLFIDTSNPGKRIELSDVDQLIAGEFEDGDTKNIQMTKLYYSDGVGYVLVEGSQNERNFPNDADYYFEYSVSTDINRIIDKIDNSGKEISYDTAKPSTNWFMSLLPTILIIAFGGIMIWVLYRMMAGSNRSAMSFGKTRAKGFVTTKVRFADIAGADEEKAELEEIVEFLKNPKKFTDLGARIPKGVLLVAIREQEKPCLHVLLRAKAMFHLFQFQDQILLKCLSALEHLGFVICLNRQSATSLALCSSMK